MKQVELRISETSKGFSPKDQWQRFNEYSKYFDNLELAKQWLKDNYGKCKKSKMYVDQNNKPLHCGYIFGFINQDISHNSKKWIQNDWISFYNINTDNIKLS